MSSKDICDPSFTYLPDKSKIEEPYSWAISIAYATLLVIGFIYLLKLYLYKKKKHLGLTSPATFKHFPTPSTDITTSTTNDNNNNNNNNNNDDDVSKYKRKLYLIGFEHDLPWCNSVIENISRRLKSNSDTNNFELIVIGRSVPEQKYSIGVSHYFSADLTRDKHLDNIFPSYDNNTMECSDENTTSLSKKGDIIVYLASPVHFKDWIWPDSEKHVCWDAPNRILSRAVNNQSSITEFHLISSSYTLYPSQKENKLQRIPKSPSKSIKSESSIKNEKLNFPKTSLNFYFKHLRSFEELVLAQNSSLLNTSVIRIHDTVDMMMNSSYSYALRSTLNKQTKIKVTDPAMLSNLIINRITKKHEVNNITDIGSDLEMSEFMKTFNPMATTSNLVYNAPQFMTAYLLKFNHICYDYLEWAPFGKYFNNSTYQMFHTNVALDNNIVATKTDPLT